MKKFVKRYSVRQRIILGVLVCSTLFFFFITPIIGWFVDYMSVPQNIHDLEVTQIVGNNSEGYVENVELNWLNPDSANRFSIDVKASNQNLISVDANDTQVSFENKDFPIEITITTKGLFGRSSKEIKFSVEKLSEGQSINTVNIESTKTTTQDDEKVGNIATSLIIASLILLSTLFVLNFNINNFKKLTLSLYPAVSALPILFLLTSATSELESGISKLSFSIGISIVFAIYLYFIQLTSNILHTSLEVNIPLGQAARAAQFIFSLISSYVVLIIFFGAGYSFIEKVGFIGLFLSFYSFSSIMMIETSDLRLILEKTLGIISTILFAIFVLSIWPINYIYGILSIAIIFYILLSISLEVRSKLSNYVMIEYSLLVSLITLILFVNGNWGILGTLI